MNDHFENVRYPHDLDVERCLIASLMLDREFAEVTVPTLSGDDFFLADHGTLLDAIRGLLADGSAVDAVILRDELKRQHKFDSIGGSAYIAQILGSVPSAAHGPEYAKRVRECSAQRKSIHAAEQMIREIQRGKNLDEVVTRAVTSMNDALSAKGANENVHWGDAMLAEYERLDEQKSTLIPFGWESLDGELGGIGPGETVVVGARPSMGKSTWCRNVAVNVAKRGTAVGYISLEESASKIVRNAISAEAEVENHRLRKAGTEPLKKEEWQKIARVVNGQRQLPIILNERCRTRDDIRAAATTMVKRHGVKLLIVDHLARVEAPGRDLFEQTTNASNGVTRIIKDLNVAGIIASQLSRASAQQEGKRPTMTDLRQSGAIEQNADGIILLHREDYYHAKASNPNYVRTGEAELIVEKFRDGEKNFTAILRSRLQFQKFEDPSPADVHCFDQPVEERKAA